MSLAVMEYCKIKLEPCKTKLSKNFVKAWYVNFLLRIKIIFFSFLLPPMIVRKYVLQVNIIVATSILEEGLDVQSCNLVVRFDPSSTVCSFIQSRGRARMHKSEYILMVER